MGAARTCRRCRRMRVSTVAMRATTSLQAARRADANQPTHDQAEIEGARMNHRALQDVAMTTKVCATHATGLVGVSEPAFEILATPAQQTHAPGSANPPAVPVDGRSGRRFLAPAPSATLRLRSVGAHANRLGTA